MQLANRSFMCILPTCEYFSPNRLGPIRTNQCQLIPVIELEITAGLVIFMPFHIDHVSKVKYHVVIADPSRLCCEPTHLILGIASILLFSNIVSTKPYSLALVQFSVSSNCSIIHFN